MSRKRRLAIIFSIVSMLALLLVTYNLVGQASPETNTNPENQDPGNTDITNGGKLFVVPEAPLGTLGLICSCGLALGIFALKKRK